MIYKGLIGAQDLEVGTSTFTRKGRTGFDIVVDQIHGGVFPWNSDYDRTIKPLDYIARGPVVDARSFLPEGYVLDGSVAYTTEIQAAIDYTPVGATLLFPKKAASEFYKAGALTLKSGITIASHNGFDYNNTNTVLKYSGTTGNFLSLNNGSSVQDGLNFEEIIIDGNNTTGKILDLGTWRSSLFRCTVKNGAAGSKGIYFHNAGSGNAVENSVERCIVRNVGTGIECSTGATDGFLKDNLIYGNNDYDIYVTSASGLLIKGNHTYLYGGNAGKNASVYIDGQFYNFSDNYIESPALKQVDLNITSFGVVIHHNKIYTHTTNNSVALEISMGTGGLTFVCDHNDLYGASAPTGTVGLRLVSGTVGAGRFTNNNISSTYDTPFDNNWGTNGENAGVLVTTNNHLDFTGDRIRFWTSHASFTSVPLEYITGFGIPEGSVTAYRGSVFASYNPNGGVNDRHFLFVKKTTSGNTGWGNVVHRSFVEGEGTAAPTTGTWSVGDTIINTAPAAGGWTGWRCITAGTPGTWKGFGALEA